MEIEKFNGALKISWCRETCYEGHQKDWTPENPTLGQCYVTALIVNDYLGGEILKVKLSSGVNHYWNLINEKEIDLTNSKFSLEKIISISVKIPREDLKEILRYVLLKSKVEKLI